MRSIDFVLLLLSLSLVLASPSLAALGKYDVRSKTLSEFGTQSPVLDINSQNGLGTTVIDNDGGGGSPLLNKLVHVIGPESSTISAPTLSGFIYLKSQTRQGPTQIQAGAGTTDSIVTWGDVTSWTITGGNFCNAVPTLICDLAMREDDDTVTPFLTSTHYDLGSWTFHGTGFVGAPFIFFTDRTGVSNGNAQYVYFGPNAPDGSVPALPLLGIAAVGLSLVALGVSGVRRKRR